ncbi:MAG: CHAT domain-containing protein [Leptolyngbya sp. SIO4C5]|nr:CHAT domain-containing protein [Leptolyngbya sp. SIO4C5]
MAQEIGDRAGAAIAFNNQGTMLINLGNFAEAVPVLQQSIQIFESLRTDLPDSQLITLADTQRAAYRYLELALVAQGQDDEALAVTERGRGRAFVLQLASRLASEGERAALGASSVTQIPTVAEIQQIARDTQTTLVTYSLQFDQALYIWVVRPTGEIEFRFVAFENDDSSGLAFNPLTSINGPLYRTAEDTSTITELVANLRNVGIRVSLDDSAQAAQLQQLYQILIDPIADLLPIDPNAKVVFVPQGSLLLVPFAALQDADGTYLIEKHTIVTVPAIQVLGLADRVGAIRDRPSYRMPQQTNNALIVGNPLMPSIWVPTADGLIETQLTNLPGAQSEAEQIASFFNADVLTGDQASEAQIKQQIETADLIHLATHGLLEYGDPQASGVRDLPGAIALAPGSGEDGLLTAAEILQLDLNADLVVLSACDTGRGRITGDGVVGLSRSLITAGVPTVVVSLWSVPDAPTAELMVTFYQQLQQGQTKAQALRQAMLQMIEQGLSPRDWAAFTLVGAAE